MQLPTPVSMTGTCDSLTTASMRPAPPRGMSTSTSPRACMSSFTLARSVPGTSWMLSTGMPAAVAASASTSTSTVLER